ncbi:MAG: YIP1 family protein [Candidatus Tectomicrobia bacterium]|uniref:YIP1 family protein n=1 Tax=Tectimicrobiota bacterium TaxID=2528274 RepID=A0A932CQR0_UNCTE|nr:YIP1 family protein [Candidatus Tectomicrobia bacterium]
MVTEMIRAASLEPQLYEEVEHDQSATAQALGVVVIVSVLTGIGNALAGRGTEGMISGLIAALVGWLIWSALTYVIGTGIFGGKATYGEMMRTLGFAYAPGALNVLRFIPVLGWVIVGIAAIWQLVAMVIAVRQGLDFGTGKALLTSLLGWIVLVVLTTLLSIPERILG